MEGGKTKYENTFTVVQQLRAENGLSPARLYTTLLAHIAKFEMKKSERATPSSSPATATSGVRPSIAGSSQTLTIDTVHQTFQKAKTKIDLQVLFCLYILFYSINMQI